MMAVCCMERQSVQAGLRIFFGNLAMFRTGCDACNSSSAGHGNACTLSAGCWAGKTSVLIEHLRKDKKARRGKLTFILAQQIGEAFVAGDIDEAELNRFLETL